MLTAEIPDATVIAADPGLHRGGMEGGDDEPEFPVLDGPVFLLGACALVDATWAVVGEDPLSEASARSRRHRTRSWFRARFRSSPSSPGRARTSPVTGGCPPASGPGSGPRSGGWPSVPSRRFAPRTPARPEEALALLIDVACETRGVDYFRSEDPMAAARSVVSDAAALLWRPYETGTGSRCSHSGRRPS